MKIIILSLLLFSVAVSHSDDSTEEFEQNSDELFDGNFNHAHPYGRPVSILKFGPNGKFIINNETMDEMFHHPEVRDRKIVAVSIIGAYRSGKSFLMDYALRYLYGHYKSIAYPNNPLNNTENWMGEPDEQLIGFSWRGGTKRDTNGVIAWSDIFLYETKNDKKLAIILLDTQGLFDSITSPTDNSRIFSLGTLASSIQIFNLKDVIQENQLEHLQLATEFSQFALKKNKEGKRRAKAFKPFQNLIFLMRDWQNKQQFDYGEYGGIAYLTTVLHSPPTQSESLKHVRNHIKSSFEKLECFLMPHPGTMVTLDSDYKGERSGLAESFEYELGRFMEFVIKPEKLVPKKILNVEVTGAEYVEYLKTYFTAFESDEFPRAESLHTITISKHFDILLNEALNDFNTELKTPNFNSSIFLGEMNEIGRNAINTAMQGFKRKRKLGSPADEVNYTNELNTLLGSKLRQWKLNHIKTFENLKRIEEQKQKELEEAERIAKSKLEEQQRQVTNEVEGIKKLNEQKQQQLNETLHAIREQSEKDMEVMRNTYEAEKIAQERENERIFNELKQQNDEMRQKVLNSQQSLQEQILKMEKQMNEKHQKMEEQIMRNRNEKLEELNILNEHKRIEIEQALKIEELKHKAEADQRNWERLMKLEEQKIFEAAEIERRMEFARFLNETKYEQQQLKEALLNTIRSG